VLSLCLAVVWRLDKGKAPNPPVVPESTSLAGVQKVAARNKAKAEVVSRLLRGKLTLLQAAGSFRCLDKAPAECPSHAWEAFPGYSDEEKLCREVICWAVSHARKGGMPGQDKAVERRLERELQAILHHPPPAVIPRL
jgi:hypothetical protein